MTTGAVKFENSDRDWKQVTSLHHLLRWVVKYHRPKMLIISEADFWRFWDSLAPSGKCYEADEDGAPYFLCLDTVVRMKLDPTPRPEIMDVSEL